jgi:hypothetical protein
MFIFIIIIYKGFNINTREGSDKGARKGRSLPK